MTFEQACRDVESAWNEFLRVALFDSILGRGAKWIVVQLDRLLRRITG